jgi:hypothetical protein
MMGINWTRSMRAMSPLKNHRAQFKEHLTIKNCNIPSKASSAMLNFSSLSRTSNCIKKTLRVKKQCSMRLNTKK